MLNKRKTGGRAEVFYGRSGAGVGDRTRPSHVVIVTPMELAQTYPNMRFLRLERSAVRRWQARALEPSLGDACDLRREVAQVHGRAVHVRRERRKARKVRWNEH